MILPPLTPRQKEILSYLYTFRFLNTNHFQKLFHHKDPHRIKEWLTDMTEKKYIARKLSRKTYEDNIKPAVYFLAAKAKHILKQQEECDPSVLERIYTEKNRTQKFIDHCFTLADIYLFFLSQKQPDEELDFFTQSELVKYDYFPDPLPSAYISVETKEETKRYFLDLFDEYTPAFVLRKRVKAYITYATKGKWEAYTNKPFPTILFVCQSERIKKHISIYTKALFDKAFEEKIELFLTTKTKILAGEKKNLWEKV